MNEEERRSATMKAILAAIDLGTAPDKPDSGQITSDELDLIMEQAGYPVIRYGHHGRGDWTSARDLERRKINRLIRAGRDATLEVITRGKNGQRGFGLRSVISTTVSAPYDKVARFETGIRELARKVRRLQDQHYPIPPGLEGAQREEYAALMDYAAINTLRQFLVDYTGMALRNGWKEHLPKKGLEIIDFAMARKAREDEPGKAKTKNQKKARS